MTSLRTLEERERGCSREMGKHRGIKSQEGEMDKGSINERDHLKEMGKIA